MAGVLRHLERLARRLPLPERGPRPENGNTLSSYAYEGGVPYPQIGFPAALQTPYEQWYRT